GDDPRHAAHVARPRRGWRAERSARPRGHRRAARRHLRDVVFRPGRLQPAPTRLGGKNRSSGAAMMGSEAFVNRPAPVTSTARPRRWLVVVAAIVAVFVLLGLLGLMPRVRLWRRLETHAQAERQQLPRVTTAHVQRAPSVVDVPLPGTTEPWLTTGIYARIDGYLKARYVDIGDRVTAGKLIAEIEAPEVDQQLNQARGTLAPSKATPLPLQPHPEPPPPTPN